MVSPRTFFSRMNEGRTSWMTEDELVKGSEEFFKLHGYGKLEFNKLFDQGDKIFNSLVVGSKVKDGGYETIVTYFRPKIDRYDVSFFGLLESLLFDILDNYEDTNLMLVTDSLSYTPLTKLEDVSVGIQNLMDEGMFLLFVNGRSGYAIFDEFKKLSMPIPVSES
jgi:hypothetical protein